MTLFPSKVLQRHRIRFAERALDLNQSRMGRLLVEPAVVFSIGSITRVIRSMSMPQNAVLKIAVILNGFPGSKYEAS
jgi:hypothetical protein